MKATDWEFTKRAMLFGMIMGFGFFLYSFDHQNAAALFANWLSAKWQWNADLVARGLLLVAALLLAVAAFLRTWASAYLHAGVVYASEVKTALLVADGPYRYVRNPLYFANALMAVALGAAMSRSGFLLAVAAMLLFCYRLIFREEAALQANQGASYAAYRNAVPRFWPAISPRIAASGRQPNWAAGWQAESWYWGFALALLLFAFTLNQVLFFGITSISILWFWLSSTVLKKRE